MSNVAVPPPPVIDCARRIAYAISNSRVEFTGSCGMIVNGKPLGRVDHFAICRNLADHDILLLYCNQDWESIAAAGYPTVDAAKDSLERAYRGLSSYWIDDPASDSDVSVFLNEHWPPCSFCGRRAYEVANIFEGNEARICDECVRKFASHVSSLDRAPA